MSDLDRFKEDEIKLAVGFFCEPLTIVSLTDSLKTSGVPADSMVEVEDELNSGIEQLRRYLFLVWKFYLCFSCILIFIS